MSTTNEHGPYERSRSYEKPAIRPEMTVRQVAADYPGCREVCVRYGEPTDRPGRFGHIEPLTRFALRNGLDTNRLLEELSVAAGVPVDRWKKTAERIHRPFVVAALMITLTLGAGWGAVLLWDIGAHHDFGAAAASWIVAHGEAQLWGFIGLFIAGVSLRTVLADAVRRRASQYACFAIFAVALLSIVAGFAWSLLPASFPELGWLSAILLLIVSATFWGTQLRLLLAKWWPTWARAVMASGFWLVLWAAVTIFLRLRAGGAGPGAYSDSARLLLIELAVFGFAMNTIYGFGQMLLPGLLRLGQTRGGAMEGAFWFHNAGVAALVAAAAGIQRPLLSTVGIAFIALGAILFAIGQRAFIGKRRTTHRAEQGHALLDWYIPLAFAWLLISLALLVIGNVYELTTHVPPPHAWVGAARHGLTVGFMTTLLVGVGQRVLPLFEHSILTRPVLVAPILILIAVGNALRVVTEIATVGSSVAYAVMPISAVLEWTALLLFAISIFSLFWHTDPLAKSGRVTQRSSLALLLAECPWMEDRLIETGSFYLARARTVPQELTIGSFAESEGRDGREVVDRINELLSERAAAVKCACPPATDELSHCRNSTSEPAPVSLPRPVDDDRR